MVGGKRWACSCKRTYTSPADKTDVPRHTSARPAVLTSAGHRLLFSTALREGHRGSKTSAFISDKLSEIRGRARKFRQPLPPIPVGNWRFDFPREDSRPQSPCFNQTITHTRCAVLRPSASRCPIPSGFQVSDIAGRMSSGKHFRPKRPRHGTDNDTPVCSKSSFRRRVAVTGHVK